MGESLLILVATGLMLVSLGLILVPAVPVSALQWALALVVAALTGFERITPPAALLMTLLMVCGSTSALWMPLLGLRGRTLSCAGLVAFFVGFIVGGLLIPLPLIGSIVGGVLAVFIVQYLQQRQAAAALRSSGTALKLIVYGMIAEFVFALLIVGVFLVSVISTAR
ncbi:MAG: DUF456 family protein [Anaerolineae bacterium]|nr:DUF456 family protein [Anaerolineae bacterium]